MDRIVYLTEDLYVDESANKMYYVRANTTDRILESSGRIDVAKEHADTIQRSLDVNRKQINYYLGE